MLHSVIFDEPLSIEDTHRNNRAQLAIELKMTPRQIDQLPYTDYLDLIDVLEFNQIQQKRIARGTAK